VGALTNPIAIASEQLDVVRGRTPRGALLRVVDTEVGTGPVGGDPRPAVAPLQHLVEGGAGLLRGGVVEVRPDDVPGTANGPERPLGDGVLDRGKTGLLEPLAQTREVDQEIERLPPIDPVGVQKVQTNWLAYQGAPHQARIGHHHSGNGTGDAARALLTPPGPGPETALARSAGRQRGSRRSAGRVGQPG
jgi:hypothetical protein